MSLHLWEAVHDADARSDPLFVVDPALGGSTPPSLQRVLLAAATLWCRTLTWPTVREISTTAAVAASTSIHAVGSSARTAPRSRRSERRDHRPSAGSSADDYDWDRAASPAAFRRRADRPRRDSSNHSPRTSDTGRPRPRRAAHGCRRDAPLPGERRHRPAIRN